MPLSTVRNKLHRAKKKMRETVKREGGYFHELSNGDKLSQFVDHCLLNRRWLKSSASHSCTTCGKVVNVFKRNSTSLRKRCNTDLARELHDLVLSKIILSLTHTGEAPAHIHLETSRTCSRGALLGGRYRGTVKPAFAQFSAVIHDRPSHEAYK